MAASSDTLGSGTQNYLLRMSEDFDDKLLDYVRVVAAITTLGLFVFAVIEGRDIATLGLIVGALSLWLGLSTFKAFR